MCWQRGFSPRRAASSQSITSDPPRESRFASIYRGTGMTAPQIKPADVGHVNAHGYGTIPHDRVEANAIQEVLANVPVTGRALKSYLREFRRGHRHRRDGGKRLVALRGVVPPTLNYEFADPECPVHVVTEPQPPRSAFSRSCSTRPRQDKDAGSDHRRSAAIADR